MAPSFMRAEAPRYAAPAEAVGAPPPRPETDAQLAALGEALDLVAKLDYQPAAAKLEGLEAALSAGGEPYRAAEAAFWLGYCYEKLDRVGDAGTQYRGVIERYPDSPAARQAAERLARISNH